MIKTAAAYIRVSTEDQTEYSPDAQLRELKEYAAAHNMILSSAHIYADEGISGRSAAKRPEFLRMVAASKATPRPFDVVLVHKFDRFARSREDSVVYKAMLRKAGVEVISIKEPLAEGSYSGVMEAIYESFAEAYSVNLGQEVRKGMAEKHRRGEPQTAPPFGYRMEGGRFYPHPVEAPVVQEIFRRFAAGDGSFFSLAKDLTARGYRTHRGGKFENRTIEYILRNPVYIGKLRWNPSGRSRRDYTNDGIVTIDGVHEPLIEAATWDAVQDRIAEQKAKWKYHGRPSSERHHWLCGIVRCAACGSTLIWAAPHYMKCNGYVRGGCSISQHIHIDFLVEAFLARLRSDMLHPSNHPAVTVVRTHGAASASAAQQEQAAAHAERKIQRLTDAYLDGAMPLDDYKRLRTQLEQELEHARQAAAAPPVPTEADTRAALSAAIEQTLRTLSSDAPISEKYDAVSSIVDRCTYDKATSSLVIYYRLIF